jgi:hypothetical protein
MCNVPTPLPPLPPAQHALVPSAMAVNLLLPAPPAMALEGMVMTDTEVKTMLHDSTAVELTYQQAIDGTGDEDNSSKEDNATHIGDMMGWVNTFIFNTCHKGGWQMEALVLKLYKVSTLCGSLWPICTHHLMSGMATQCAL